MMRWPLDTFTISQHFGDNPAFYGPGGHTGTDLAAPEGTPIKAPVSGTVIVKGTDASYAGGLFVIIRENTPEKLEHYLGHQSLIEVALSQKVTEGQEIGKVGHTGLATGPHVHYQIRHFNGGALIDPETLIKEEEMPTQEQVLAEFRYWKVPDPTQQQLDYYSAHPYTVLYYDLGRYNFDRRQELEAAAKPATVLKPGTYKVS